MLLMPFYLIGLNIITVIVIGRFKKLPLLRLGGEDRYYTKKTLSITPSICKSVKFCNDLYVRRL